MSSSGVAPAATVAGVGRTSKVSRAWRETAIPGLATVLQERLRWASLSEFHGGVPYAIESGSNAISAARHGCSLRTKAALTGSSDTPLPDGQGPSALPAGTTPPDGNTPVDWLMSRNAP